MAGPLEDNMSLEDLTGVMLRRSGITVDFDPDGKSRIYANSAYLEISGEKIASVINREISRLTAEQKEKLVVGIIAVVTQKVAQSGEFTDL